MKWSEFKQLVDDELRKYDTDDAEIEYFDFHTEVEIIYNEKEKTIIAY